jgi:hypothetical protein
MPGRKSFGEQIRLLSSRPSILANLASFSFLDGENRFIRLQQYIHSARAFSSILYRQVVLVKCNPLVYYSDILNFGTIPLYQQNILLFVLLMLMCTAGTGKNENNGIFVYAMRMLSAIKTCF